MPLKKEIDKYFLNWQVHNEKNVQYVGYINISIRLLKKQKQNRMLAPSSDCNLINIFQTSLDFTVNT